jgi:hypothetical protein
MYKVVLVFSLVMWATIIGIIVSTRLLTRREHLWEHPEHSRQRQDL